VTRAAGELTIREYTGFVI